MSKSIIQENKDKCFLCGGQATEEHHVIFGSANRKLSEKYGLKVYLCADCHRLGRNAVHKNYETNIKLRIIAQRKFMEEYPFQNFVQIFGRNYI